MYTLKDNGIVEEIECGNNFGYVLNSSNYFVNTDYKVLLSQTSDIFVKCMKVRYNGKIEMLYLTDDYRPMSTMFNGIQPDTLITIILNLFAAIIEVKNNGFLSSQNIDVSWDKIFVNSSTLKVKLVYVPVNYRVFDSYSEFEGALRSSLIKLINKVILNQTPRLQQLILDLSDGTLSILDLYNKSKSVGMDNISDTKQNLFDNNVVNSGYSTLQSKTDNVGVRKLIAVNAPCRIEIMLDREVTVIGKKQEMVDVAITFNNMISRKHCRIERKSGLLYIADEGSANGTFINGFKITAGQLYQISQGDIIRMADSDFQLV